MGHAVNGLLPVRQGSTGRARASIAVVALLVPLALVSGLSPALAQICPTLAVVANTACTVPPATVITVAPANAVGLNASGPLGQITANGDIANLGAASTIGALSQAGASISFDGSELKTTSTTTATSALQVGLRATGAGSTLNAAGSSITMGPANGTTNASGMIGATAEDGGVLNLSATPITMLGANGINNRGLVATGIGSHINYLGGTISTRSVAAFGVFANSGGEVALSAAARVTTTGAGSASVGSHALYALGSGSRINGAAITLSTAGTFANAARAELGVGWS